ncbi:PaaI family thioesterase [Aquisalimonas sp.]|uniref:PaaI family thioesterase n=1 Tax=Aquisalimonas sp. TaxID=1872621 RepID=UPI0025C73CCC|nr:PaaI family thioesterase [Aquisalimonas sp.]
MKLEPKDADFEARVRESFQRQQVMTTFGATMTRVSGGEVEIELPFNAALTQQHGYLHAGVITTILDNACGYAASTLMDRDSAVLTVEFKTNFMAPARGELLRCTANVVRAGKTLTVCRAEAWMHANETPIHTATMQATLMALAGTDARRG